MKKKREEKKTMSGACVLVSPFAIASCVRTREKRGRGRGRGMAQRKIRGCPERREEGLKTGETIV